MFHPAASMIGAKEKGVPVLLAMHNYSGRLSVFSKKAEKLMVVPEFMLPSSCKVFMLVVSV